ncbi:helix-turn-helix domain-containing protein [Halomarina salina]|uniref:Helix-turn-helix domain-containing protein n=1 Tax=Halomarina salina TaxID=1872699 RepID=A0ABD5RNJ9_9EURY|nr:helix-turn-helix domain-containing protein [Halomarina salina]
MTVIAGVVVDAEDFAIGDVLSPTTTRIDLTQFVPIDGQLAPYFWKEHGGEKAEFERRVRADDRVRSLTYLDGRVDAHLYHVEWADDINGFLSALRDNDVLVERGRTTNGGSQWQFTLRAFSQRDLSAFQSACHESDVQLDIRRVHHNPDSSSDGERRMSGKQREAVVTALKGGYFNVPRGKSQTELAEEVGISRQAFARRLKRAERTVFESMFWDELEAP